jgi:bifunctional non-homologous end joining protein LigD
MNLMHASVGNLHGLIHFGKPEAVPEGTAAAAVSTAKSIAYGSDGRPQFHVLQNHRAGPELHLYAFDLVTLRGRDLMPEPLAARREILLDEIMPQLPDSIRYSETIEASPAELVEAVREQGFEGIVARRRDSPYKPCQRSADGRRCACSRRAIS